ncbi:MAG: hypothetical protein HY270_16260, partial [Deltaproteobacteria bacterium]|nr:hypothetical protein [Deltaproteobacteria bacterium]
PDAPRSGLSRPVELQGEVRARGPPRKRERRLRVDRHVADALDPDRARAKGRQLGSELRLDRRVEPLANLGPGAGDELVPARDDSVGSFAKLFAESIQAIITQTLIKKRAGGRIAALEILIGTPAVRNLIRENKIHQLPSALQTGQAFGMQTLDMALLDLVGRGLVTKEEAQSRTLTPNLFGPPGQGPGDAKAGAPRPVQRAAFGR